MKAIQLLLMIHKLMINNVVFNGVKLKIVIIYYYKNYILLLDEKIWIIYD